MTFSQENEALDCLNHVMPKVRLLSKIYEILISFKILV